MQPDLRTYDYIIINTSAGKDSQAMMDYIVELADQQGVKKALIAVHADLGRMEWAGTRELAEQQAAAYGIPFRVVSRPQGDLLAHVNERKMWPSSTARYCTSDHKRDQVAKIVRELSKGRYSTKILNCMGLRAQESPARAKRANFLPNKRLTTKSRQVDEWLPIQDWSEEEVWARIKKSGVPYHRAYDLGMPRLSCVFCIFAPRAALILAGKHNRELLNEYVETEARIGHTFRLGTPMSEIKEAVEADEAIEPISSNWNM